jgi:hypothetical protein
MILHRMERIGLGLMPYIASSVVDQEGTTLIREWLSKLGANSLDTPEAINPRPTPNVLPYP